MALVDIVLENRLGSSCTCGRTTWSFHALAPARVTLHDGGPCGVYRWGFVGAEFLRTTYRIACAACDAVAWARSAAEGCPRCYGYGKLAAALERATQLELPRACTCSSTTLTEHVHVPVQIISHGPIVGAPIVRAAPGEAGYHVQSVICASCEAAQYANPHACVCND